MPVWTSMVYAAFLDRLWHVGMTTTHHLPREPQGARASFGPNDWAETIQYMKTKFWVFTLVAVLLTYAISPFAQLPPEARAGLWKAQWITSPSSPQRDTVVLHFRKVIEIPAVPEHFVVHVSAD